MLLKPNLEVVEVSNSRDLLCNAVLFILHLQNALGDSSRLQVSLSLLFDPVKLIQHCHEHRVRLVLQHLPVIRQLAQRHVRWKDRNYSPWKCDLQFYYIIVIKERRLSWLGHVLRMEDYRIPHQAITWELMDYNRNSGRPRKNSMDIIRRDLKDLDTRREVAEELAIDRAEWRQNVAQCIHHDAGLTKI